MRVHHIHTAFVCLSIGATLTPLHALRISSRLAPPVAQEIRVVTTPKWDGAASRQDGPDNGIRVVVMPFLGRSMLAVWSASIGSMLMGTTRLALVSYLAPPHFGQGWAFVGAVEGVSHHFGHYEDNTYSVLLLAYCIWSVT